MSVVVATKMILVAALINERRTELVRLFRLTCGQTRRMTEESHIQNSLFFTLVQKTSHQL